MASIETVVAVGGGLVAVGFPLVGYLVYRLVHSGSGTAQERQDQVPPAHGHDRRR